MGFRRTVVSPVASLLLAGSILFASGCHPAAHTSAVAPGATPAPPLLAVLDQFSAPDVPDHGADEAAPIPHNWPEPTSAPDVPGNELAQHPMLYVGEGYNVIFVVNDGKVVWSYSYGKGGEIDDVWMLSNGHILAARQHHVDEVTPEKQIVWHYDPPAGTEVHTCQPIGLDKVLLVQNGLPPKMMIINKKTGAVELEHDLPALSLTDPKTVHPQFRHFRMTAAGTYLAPMLSQNKVMEFDKDFNPIWTYQIMTPWDAVRLHNGNTLITDEHERLVREVNPKGETVWQFTAADYPPGIVSVNPQTAERLSNGDTVIFYSGGGEKKQPYIVQAVEVSPDKKVVWVLQDWKDLGPATTGQFLDQPGIPEHPGDLQQ
jgi:hypothetical protein